MYLKSVTSEQAIWTLFHEGPTGNGYHTVRQNQSKYPGTQVWALSENCKPSGHFWIGSWTPSRHSENNFFVIPTFPFSHSATAASLRFPKMIQNKWNRLIISDSLLEYLARFLAHFLVHLNFLSNGIKLDSQLQYQFSMFHFKGFWDLMTIIMSMSDGCHQHWCSLQNPFWASVQRQRHWR